MRPGDVLAFGGQSWFSKGIKLITRSPVSHVASVLYHRRSVGDPYYMVAESSTGGVALRRLSKVIDTYKGEVWWLRLNDEARGRLDVGKMTDFLLSQEGKGYDDLQCWLQPTGLNHEDFDKFYCSELVSAALEAGGIVGTINASETTPIEVCRWNIYHGIVQLKGDPLEIRGFNSRPI